MVSELLIIKCVCYMWKILIRYLSTIYTDSPAQVVTVKQTLTFFLHSGRWCPWNAMLLKRGYLQLERDIRCY
jgi:hypothetical protein